MLDLRTKATIEEGIQWRHKNNDGSEAVCYCPGDGTRYVIFVSPIKYPPEILKQMGLADDLETFLITLASDPGSARSAFVYRGQFVGYDWLRPKLNVTIASAVTLSEFIAWLIGGQAWSREEAQARFSE